MAFLLYETRPKCEGCTDETTETVFLDKSTCTQFIQHRHIMTYKDDSLLMFSAIKSMFSLKSVLALYLWVMVNFQKSHLTVLFLDFSAFC